MKVQLMLLTVVLVAAASPADAQDTHQMAQTAGSSAEVAQCMQAQAVVTPTLEATRAQLERARQTNSPAAMRATVDALDAVLLDVRTRLEPCGHMSATAAGPVAGHAMPSTPPDPAAAPAGQNMANMPGHNMATMPAPATQKPAAASRRGAAPAAPNQAAAPAGQNMANMPGHNMAAMPAPAIQKAAPRRGAAPVAPNQAAAPSDQNMANMPGHNMAKMPAPAAADAHAQHAMTTAANPAARLADLMCQPAVNPKTAPRATYLGKAYYFCSIVERDLFLKTPGKYLQRQ